MTARHAAIQAPSSAPCPFCGCGTALAAHKPARKVRRSRVQEDRSGYPTIAALLAQPFSGQSPTVAGILQRGHGAPVVAELTPAYTAHIDAGHVLVSDQSGAYWTTRDGKPVDTEWRAAA